jgi:hypothetical protein
MADGEGESGDGRAAGVIKLLLVFFVVLTALAYFTPKPSEETVISGVKVVSEMPLERLQGMQYIALYNTTASPAELTCKFELSAISKPAIKGYKIRIGEGDPGIYLGADEAFIKGRTGAEILSACHVFACLRDGLECPNFMLVDSFFRNADSMSVILDERVGSEGGRGYAEVVGALSFLQSRRADANGDWFVNQSEVDANDFFIYPFLMDGDICLTQPFNNLIQNWSGTNQTYECGNIAPAVVFTSSDEGAINVVGNQLVISGSDKQIHTGGIVVRDVIAPEWIRRIYGYM